MAGLPRSTQAPVWKRSRNEVSSWHTSARKTSNHRVNGRMREQVKGGDTRGRLVGGGFCGQGGGWVVREWKGP